MQKLGLNLITGNLQSRRSGCSVSLRLRLVQRWLDSFLATRHLPEANLASFGAELMRNNLWSVTTSQSCANAAKLRGAYNCVAHPRRNCRRLVAPIMRVLLQQKSICLQTGNWHSAKVMHGFRRDIHERNLTTERGGEVFCHSA